MRFIGLGMLLIALSSCNEACLKNAPKTCTDQVPNKLCQAFFERWFVQNGQCIKIQYYGCSEKGFATQLECGKCMCK